MNIPADTRWVQAHKAQSRSLRLGSLLHLAEINNAAPRYHMTSHCSSGHSPPRSVDPQPSHMSLSQAHRPDRSRIGSSPYSLALGKRRQRTLGSRLDSHYRPGNLRRNAACRDHNMSQAQRSLYCSDSLQGCGSGHRLHRLPPQPNNHCQLYTEARNADLGRVAPLSMLCHSHSRVDTERAHCRRTPRRTQRLAHIESAPDTLRLLAHRTSLCHRATHRGSQVQGCHSSLDLHRLADNTYHLPDPQGRRCHPSAHSSRSRHKRRKALS